MRFAASAVFVAVFVPISLYRRVRGSSRFGARFHRGPSAWDLPRAVDPR
ncbi:hypothetical protein [Streptomyces gobitricini]|uniref:Uncharacterized protein n=1 Tax=Streptomyces gobitricini TaxID=68211 RepID=A0ABN3L353_9ACTN